MVIEPFANALERRLLLGRIGPNAGAAEIGRTQLPRVNPEARRVCPLHERPVSGQKGHAMPALYQMACKVGHYRLGTTKWGMIVPDSRDERSDECNVHRWRNSDYRRHLLGLPVPEHC
jgi:hypothetical protein